MQIKVIDVTEKTCTTLNANLKLCEPSSLCLVEDYHSDKLKEKVLLVADTNNHRIVPISLFEYSVKEVSFIFICIFSVSIFMFILRCNL